MYLFVAIGEVCLNIAFVHLLSVKQEMDLLEKHRPYLNYNCIFV